MKPHRSRMAARCSVETGMQTSFTVTEIKGTKCLLGKSAHAFCLKKRRISRASLYNQGHQKRACNDPSPPFQLMQSEKIPGSRTTKGGCAKDCQGL